MARLLARHASGLSLKQIAGEEYMSYQAVKKLAQETRRLLLADNMAQCVVIAFYLGYITLPDESGNVSVVDSTTRQQNARGGSI